MNKVPNEEQMQALRQYANRHGKEWKRHLANAWWEGTDAAQPGGHLLRQVRNQLGPQWLAKFKFDPSF